MTDLIETPTVSVPSISSSAMLVELSISVWTGRKKDKQAQAEVEQAHGTAKNVTNVTKKLMGDHPLLTQIQKFAAGVRTNIHYHLTMPWADTGPRLLTTPCYFDYHKRMTGAQQEFEVMVAEFVDGYEFDLVQAQMREQALGSLFNANDYPSAAELRRKFGFHINYMPVPEQGDFRLDIANEAVAELKAQYTSFYERKLVEAQNDIFRRLYDVMSRMSERLADPEAGFEGSVTKKGHKKFGDSLVENIIEMVDVMSRCNVTGDEVMSRMERQLKAALTGITPDALREDRNLRLTTKRQIDEAIAALPSLDW